MKMADGNGNGDGGAAVEALSTAKELASESDQALKEEEIQEVVDLEIPFKIELDGELCAGMIGTLVKYLLYLRGQIPCVYDEFHTLVHKQHDEETAALAAGTRKRKLVGGNVKKARKLVELADHTLGTALLQMFQRRVHTVAIVFGTTVLSPREVWRIDFRGCGSVQATGDTQSTTGRSVQGKEGATIPRERVVRLCVQKLIRTVLSYATQHFSSPLAVTSTHLLVLAEKSEIPLEGFVPKQQLRVRYPTITKTGKRTHKIEIQHSGFSTQTQDARDHGETEEPELLWYQSVRPLQGLSRLS